MRHKIQNRFNKAICGKDIDMLSTWEELRAVNQDLLFAVTVHVLLRQEIIFLHCIALNNMH